MKGKLIVISGPSAVGKDSVVSEYLKNNNAKLSVSATSRKIRANEKEGVNYYYLTKEEFEEKIEKGYFLEHFIYNNNYYGTPKDKIDELLNKGIDVILVIEVQGALYIKNKIKDSINIFILPPSKEELERRIRNRNIDSEEDIINRLKIADNEIKESIKYDYRVINYDIKQTAKEIENIVKSIKI